MRIKLARYEEPVILDSKKLVITQEYGSIKVIDKNSGYVFMNFSHQDLDYIEVSNAD